MVVTTETPEKLTVSVAEACGIEVVDMSLNAAFAKIRPFYQALIGVVNNHGQ